MICDVNIQNSKSKEITLGLTQLKIILLWKFVVFLDFLFLPFPWNKREEKKKKIFCKQARNKNPRK